VVGNDGTIGSMSWAGLDPQKDYSGVAWELFRCCLLRTLFSYNGRPSAEGGGEVRPDLASGPPEVSADGFTWTIHVEPGIHYAPPLEDLEIVAQDFVRALMRMASRRVTPDRCNGCYYTSYYSVIEGFDAYRSGAADTIAGLETPDEHTVVIHLTEPTGDLPDRLALGATAPIPPNPHRPDAVYGVAQGHHRGYGYGPFLVASGPYMIEGAQDLDLSVPPAEQAPLSGWVEPGHELVLVRNPSWDPETDELRAAYADRIEVDDSGVWRPSPARAIAEELASAVEAGTVDHVLDLAYTPAQIRRYRTDPTMQGHLTTASTGLVFYIVMKLPVPPFDDLYVRRAVAYAIDEAKLRRSVAHPRFGFAFRGQPMVATHIAPDEIEGNLLASYDPYPTSLERARQEMALSRYDRDHDGLCDAPACRSVLALVKRDNMGQAGAEEVAASLAAIGIDLQVEFAPSGPFFRRLNDVEEKVPLGVGQGFRYDYLNASTFLPFLFTSEYIGLWNWSLLGATRSQLRQGGYEVTTVPNVDDRIGRCMALTGLAQTECWADLDRYLMEEVVPFVPYLASERTRVVSERVASSSFSPATGVLALDRTALVESSE